MSEIEYEYRIGIGTDIHRLTPDKPLMLGGMEIPYPLGLLAHSDGDVALHAIIDAILGAACMGDIGTLFPDSDPKWKDVDSKELVVRTRVEYENKEWEIVNVDLIIHAEQPKLGAYKGQMKRAIAGLLGIDFSHVNVKAKTNEGIGEIGGGNAIGATATAMLRRRFKRRL